MQRPSETLEVGPYVLHSLLDDIPLVAEGDASDISINCVEFWNGNLYIGTSAAELLHFVQIPPDATDTSAAPSFILASRAQPAFAQSSANSSRPGVQQILLLPRVAKACILCNWTVTFYSLPELTPAFGATQVKNCNWIGGVDLNEPQEKNVDSSNDDDNDNNDDEPAAVGVTVLLSLNKRIQVVRVSHQLLPRVIRRFEFAGSTLSVRRDSFACVADSTSYALLDVEQQRKIPLMPISALNLPDTPLPPHGSGTGLLVPEQIDQRHVRNSSISSFLSVGLRKPPDQQHLGDGDEALFEQASQSQTPVPPLWSETHSQSRGDASQNSVPSLSSPPPNANFLNLKPHIASPTREEFLIVTGTTAFEQGIGIFVNLDGDPTRPPVTFETYPRHVAVDGSSVGDASSPSKGTAFNDEEGWVLASIERETEGVKRYGLEIQRWDVEEAEGQPTKYWLECPAPRKLADGKVPTTGTAPVGIRSVVGSNFTTCSQVFVRLCKRRYYPFAAESPVKVLKRPDPRTAVTMERVQKEQALFERNLDSPPDDEVSVLEDWEAKHNEEEEEYAQRLASMVTRLAVWSGDHVWWALRNPLLVQLEAMLNSSIRHADGTPYMDRRRIFIVLESLMDREEKNELEFYTFSYIKQRASLLLFTSFLHSEQHPFSNAEMAVMGKTLVESLLDPRVVLSLVPGLRHEVIESAKGIWVYGGIRTTVQDYRNSRLPEKGGDDDRSGKLGNNVLPFLKVFLTTWRKKKGFGSVADESEVFRTVDAALLNVLLLLDQHSPKGRGRSGSVRSELYDLVDTGVECFERAVSLLESYHRLFVLSRLYQSRHMSSDVLATWKRIIEGERDDGEELVEGEQRMCDYLGRISSQALVQEYAVWLANRNPKLGVQVFANERSRTAVKFEPAHVVSVLRAHAPAAVKYYLEHLVFGKGHTQHVNELIMFYLDLVLHSLASSSDARDAARSSYDSYRALRPPKPTYRQVLVDNAPSDDEAWNARLRLLQLLGGAHDYDPVAIRARINHTEQSIWRQQVGEGSRDSDNHTSSKDDDNDDDDHVLLVPETIILDGRQRRHKHALRLLVRKLGDYDTALAYCLRGGRSLYTSSVFSVDATVQPMTPVPAPAPQSPISSTKTASPSRKLSLRTTGIHRSGKNPPSPQHRSPKSPKSPKRGSLRKKKPQQQAPPPPIPVQFRTHPSSLPSRTSSASPNATKPTRTVVTTAAEPRRQSLLEPSMFKKLSPTPQRPPSQPLSHLSGASDTAFAPASASASSSASAAQHPHHAQRHPSSPPPPPPPAHQPPSPPSFAQQRRLFAHLLRLFLALEDVSDRVEQTSNLLDRFGSWLDADEDELAQQHHNTRLHGDGEEHSVSSQLRDKSSDTGRDEHDNEGDTDDDDLPISLEMVLAQLPDDWAVEVFEGFLTRALRRLVARRHESEVVRAMSQTQNLAAVNSVLDARDAAGRCVFIEKQEGMVEEN